MKTIAELLTKRPEELDLDLPEHQEWITEYAENARQEVIRLQTENEKLRDSLYKLSGMRDTSEMRKEAEETLKS